jgi:hypothetical protein
MQSSLKAFVLLGLGATLASASSASAADLSLHPSARQHAIHRGYVRAVRDYDGTPIVLRRVRAFIRPGYDDVPLVSYEAFWAMRASPTRYLNGQPVRVGWRSG